MDASSIMLNDVTEQKLYKTNENHLIIDQTSHISRTRHAATYKAEPSINYHCSRQICMETVANGHKSHKIISKTGDLDLDLQTHIGL